MLEINNRRNWANQFDVVVALCNIKFNTTVSLNSIIIARAKTSKQYPSTSTREFFYPFKNLDIDTVREF